MTSDNLSAGDVVVRVHNAAKDPFMPIGTVCRVLGVVPAEDGTGPGLWLAGWPNEGRDWFSWDPARFRKIDTAEDCFVKAMREILPLETAGEHTRT